MPEKTLTEICNKCFRPKHTVEDMNGVPFVQCVAMDPETIIFTDQYKCSCCKCVPDGTRLIDLFPDYYHYSPIDRLLAKARGNLV